MKEVCVTIVGAEGGDWTGLFVNGKLEYEGHNIYETNWVELINKYKHFKEVETFTVTDDYLDRGNFPDKFKDIPENEFVK